MATADHAPSPRASRSFKVEFRTERCDERATTAMSIAFIEAADPAAFEGGETRRIELRFPGVEVDFEGGGERDYLGKLALV